MNRRGPRSHDLTVEERQRGGQSTSPAKRTAAATNGRAARASFRATDEGREAMRRGGKSGVVALTPEVRTANGIRVNQRRWFCLTCGKVSTAMGVANHQRLGAGQHAGRIPLDPPATTKSGDYA